MKDFSNLVVFLFGTIFLAGIFTYIKDRINVKISALEIDKSIIDLFFKKATTNINEIIERRYSCLQEIQKEKCDLRKKYRFYSYLKLFLEPLFFISIFSVFYFSFLSP